MKAMMPNPAHMGSLDHLATTSKQFLRIAPYAFVSGVLFSVIAILVGILGVHDLIRSTRELPSRFLYSAVMTVAFSTSIGIAAFYAFSAWGRLRHLASNRTAEAIECAIEGLILFLRVFYFWLALLLVAFITAICLPAY